MSFSIREATGGDVAALVNLYRSAYKENERMGFPSSVVSVDEATVRKWLRTRSVFVATRNGEIVGASQLIPRSDWEVPEIGRLAVSPDWQERGIGGDLLESTEQYANSEGWDRIRLRTLSGHPFLEGWYRRAGYERVGIERLDERPYDAPVLEKEL
ncbi:GNAT family N-acetyltransferase [Halostella litorea]|uniref:GNAT family N-acetyltransferase n=1 Tax=Halostella litorea TaxID=2528831 RepID=UPI0013872E48|nr:GNAT family N-acetyltransferase [Halostella litorea]